MRILVLGLALWLGAPAMAQCPQTAVQDAVNVWASVSQQAPPDAEAKIEALSAACADNAYVLKVAALTHGLLSQKATAPEKILAHGARARALATRMRDVQPANEESVMAQVGANWIPIRMFGDNFDRDILLVYFGAQQRAKLLDVESRPPAPGEALRTCRPWDRVEAQEVSVIIRENLKTDLTAPLGYLDRVIAICDAEINAKQHEILLGLRARSLYKLLTDNPKRADAQAMLDKLTEDSKRFFALRPNGDLAYWSTYDRDRLAAFTVEFDVANGNVPPRSEWFKPGNTENALVVRAIALALDDAWAEDEPRGVTGRYQTYRDLMSKLYAEASTSGNVIAAKAALAAAAKGQSDGSMRRAENKTRQAPPDWLWTWIAATPQPQ